LQRRITGFLRDEHGDWIASLDCGHRQHVRHNPPFMNRPWVVSEEGRAEQLGKEWSCPPCDRFEMPSDFVAYKRTPEFTEATVPQGLLRDHSTKAGVWAQIRVLDGTLRYHVPSLSRRFDLTRDAPGIVIAEVVHHVEPLGPVRFYVEFFRAPSA
jgi:tellurite methyltransferase